ncbi:MAG: VTT domain-containing protein [Bdellovibrionaceae bacterium]|nr:VTT domain-containing protein [Pseudobdellovibrionaceae bacterium]
MLAVVRKYNPNILFRKLYDWVMNWAENEKSIHFLCLLASCESVFFPIPVDPFLMAVSTAKPKKAIGYALLASIFSVLGGGLGYFLGHLFWEGSQDFFFNYIFSPEKFQLVLNKFQENAFWTIFMAGFTPIPFKVFTLAAGVAHIALIPFFLGSLISRTLRFCIEGGLIYFYGPKIRAFIELYFERITMAIGAIIVVAIIIYKLIG